MATSARASSWWDLLGGVASESRRVVAAHSRHFLALSVLFLLPLSSLLVAFPLLFFPSSASPFLRPPPQSLLRTHSPAAGPHHHRYLLLLLISSLSALALALCAAASVSRSAHHGFFGRPVKLLPALRSLARALPRLLLTLLAAASLLAFLLTLAASLLLLALRALHLVHVASPTLAYLIAFVLTALTLLYLSINWTLAGVVSVIESSWGFEPLQRSAHLVRGMRWVVLCLNLTFTSAIGFVLWGFSLGAEEAARRWGEVLPVVARTAFGSAAITVLLLYWLVATTVLYMYCKALHGELAGEIAEEFAWEYVCLPFDDQKVPHVVSIVQQ